MKKRFCFKEANAIFEAKSLLFKIVTVQDGTSSCPAKPDKKHRRFLRCESRQENSLTSKLDTNFSASSPAVLNSCHKFFVKTRENQGKQKALWLTEDRKHCTMIGNLQKKEIDSILC